MTGHYKLEFLFEENTCRTLYRTLNK